MLLIGSEATSSLHAQAKFQATAGLAGNEIGRGIIQSGDGNYVAVGISDGIASPTVDVYVVKLNFCGQVLWTRAYDLGGYDEPNKIRRTPEGDYVIVGTTYDLDGNYDAFLLKIDSQGGVVWSNLYGAEGVLTVDKGTDVQVDRNTGDIYACGSSDEATAGERAWIWRTTSAGAIVWSKLYDSQTGDVFHSLALACDDDIIAVGATNLFDANNNQNILEVSVDRSNGSVNWGNWFGGNGLDWAASVVVNDATNEFWVGANVIVAGRWNSKELFHAAPCSSGVRNQTIIVGGPGLYDGTDVREISLRNGILYATGILFDGQAWSMHITCPGSWNRRYRFDDRTWGNSLVQSAYSYPGGSHDMVALGGTWPVGSFASDFYFVGTDAIGRSECHHEDYPLITFQQEFQEGAYNYLLSNYEVSRQAIVRIGTGVHQNIVCTHCLTPPPPPPPPPGFEDPPVIGHNQKPSMGSDRNDGTTKEMPAR